MSTVTLRARQGQRILFSDRRMESSTKGRTKYLNILLGVGAFSTASLRGPYSCQCIRRNLSCKSDCRFTSSYCHNIIIQQGLRPEIWWWDMVHLLSYQLGYYFIFICPYVYASWMQDRQKVIAIYAAALSPILRGGAKKLAYFRFCANRFVFRAFNHSICTVSEILFLRKSPHLFLKQAQNFSNRICPHVVTFPLSGLAASCALPRSSISVCSAVDIFKVDDNHILLPFHSPRW